MGSVVCVDLQHHPHSQPTTALCPNLSPFYAEVYSEDDVEKFNHEQCQITGKSGTCVWSSNVCHNWIVDKSIVQRRPTPATSSLRLLLCFRSFSNNPIFPKSVLSTSISPLPVSPERQCVLPLPGLSPSSLGVVVSVTLVETTGLLASGSETTHFAVLVDGGNNPVDAGILADGLVLRVDEDNLEVLVGGVLVDPVGVEDAEVGTAATDTLLGDRAERALELELVDTLVGGLTCISKPKSVSLFFLASKR